MASGVSSGTKHSAAKRGRVGIEFDGEELMKTLGVDEEHLVLGIDEAGRGPLIGPMVYTGAMVSIREHDLLVDSCGVADSKVLAHAHRIASLEKLKGVKTLDTLTIVISPEMIAEKMTGRCGQNLNTLSHDAAIEIIHQATLEAKGKLCAVYVDTVGPPESYLRKLSGRFPHLRVTVAKQADAKFPIVSAASIVAKTTRDAHVDALGINCGSGYPSDPHAVSWLRSNLHRFFVLSSRHNFVRHSWGPVDHLAQSVCEEVTFAKDETKDQTQRRLVFTKPTPRRQDIFAHLLKLRTVSALPSEQI